MATNQPQTLRREVPLPSFRPPLSQLTDPDLPEIEPPATDQPTEPATTTEPAESPSGRWWQRTQRPDPDATRTPTSASTGESKPPKADAKSTARLIAGLLAVLAGAAAVAIAISSRHTAQLRRPTGEELDDIAAPLARIAIRHVPAGLLNEDLADAVLAASAAGAYLTAGPLVERFVDEGDLPDPDSEEYRP